MKTDDYDDRTLEKLIKALGSDKTPVGRIGVLGSKTTRQAAPGGTKAPPTNAEIGAKHELGLEGMPIRSWLRIPMIDNLQKYLEKSKAFTPKAFMEVIKQGSIIPWLAKAMIESEGLIRDGFDSGGFGKWKPSDMKYKKNHQTLVESTQLRDSVTSEIK